MLNTKKQYTNEISFQCISDVASYLTTRGMVTSLKCDGTTLSRKIHVARSPTMI